MLRISMFFCLLLLVSAASAQTMQYGLGLSYVAISPQKQSFTAQLAPDRPPSAVVTPLDFKSYISLAFHPSVRIAYWAKPKIALRLGAPITLSMFYKTGVYNGQSYVDDRNFTLFQAPLQIEVAFGEMKSKKDNPDKQGIGGYAGFGMSVFYHSIRSEQIFIGQKAPYLSAGLRYWFSGHLAFQVAAATNFMPVYEGPTGNEYLVSTPKSVQIYRPNAPRVVRTLTFSLILQ